MKKNYLTRDGRPRGYMTLMSYGSTVGYAKPIRDHWWKKARCFHVLGIRRFHAGTAYSLEEAFVLAQRSNIEVSQSPWLL